MKYNNDQDDNILAEAYLNEVWFKKKKKSEPTKEEKAKVAQKAEDQLVKAKNAVKAKSKK